MVDTDIHVDNMVVEDKDNHRDTDYDYTFVAEHSSYVNRHMMHMGFAHNAVEYMPVERSAVDIAENNHFAYNR